MLRRLLRPVIVAAENLPSCRLPACTTAFATLRLSIVPLLSPSLLPSPPPARSRSLQIKNRAVVNENTSGSVAALQAEIRSLRGELAEFKCEC